MKRQLLAVALIPFGSAAGASAAAPPKTIDCGRYTNMNWPVTSSERTKNRCLVAAFQRGARAKLITARATVEGDPITIYYRVFRPRRLELIADARRDQHGGPEDWYRSVCTALTATANYRHLQPSRCRKAALPRTLPPRWASS